MLFGLSVGLTVALVVYLQTGGQNLPARAGQVAEQTAPTSGIRQPKAEQATPPGTEPKESSTPETQLEFYRLLQQLEVSVDSDSPAPGSKAGATDEYVIQAGSFETIEEADSRKARLALSAIDSHIETAIVNTKIWHRVIIGPVTERSELNRIVRRLNDEKIESFSRQVSD
jgi:cell division protein FtsN